LFVYIW